MAVKLNWYQYFDSWEQACGGNAIRKHFKKSAQLLNEEEWKEVMKKFAQHLLTFCENTKPSLVIFGGGIAFKQTSRLYSSIHAQILEHKLPEIQISALGEDAGLYGAFGLLKQEVV
jgi:predicted NBD/HSP70 family sugar kinase